VNPVPSTSHLQVAQEGLQFLESIDTPVAPVVVIGPYRSGKSFLLNQLLGVPCSESCMPAAFAAPWPWIHHTQRTMSAGAMQMQEQQPV
jgi:hypothetical protein